MNFENIILASQSERRSQLLRLAEIPFEVVTQPTDESFPDDLLPKEIAIHIAVNKAIAVQNFIDRVQYNSYAHTIIAADTIVVLGDNIIGKRKDKSSAIATLQALSGNRHSVITGVCILHKEKRICFAEETFVEFNELTKYEMEHYVDTYHPYDKAGAYAIQEWIGAIGIRSINGDYYNVMGLPVQRLVKELQQLFNK